MDTKQHPKTFAVVAGWAALLVGFFAFGEKKGYAPLPSCSACDCRNVTFWQNTLGVNVGAFVKGATDKTQQTTQAILNINTAAPCDGTPQGQDGQYDQFQINGGSVICDPPALSGYPIELQIDPLAFGWVGGATTYNRYFCPSP